MGGGGGRQRPRHMSFRLQQRGQCPGVGGRGPTVGRRVHLRDSREKSWGEEHCPLLPQGWPMTRRPCLRQEPQNLPRSKASLWLGMLQEGRGRLGGRDTPGIMTGICSWAADTKPAGPPAGKPPPKHEVIWGTHSGCRAHLSAGRPQPRRDEHTACQAPVPGLYG